MSGTESAQWELVLKLRSRAKQASGKAFRPSFPKELAECLKNRSVESFATRLVIFKLPVEVTVRSLLLKLSFSSARQRSVWQVLSCAVRTESSSRQVCSTSSSSLGPVWGVRLFSVLVGVNVVLDGVPIGTQSLVVITQATHSGQHLGFSLLGSSVTSVSRQSCGNEYNLVSCSGSLRPKSH